MNGRATVGKRSTPHRSLFGCAKRARRTSEPFAARSTAACSTMPSCRLCAVLLETGPRPPGARPHAPRRGGRGDRPGRGIHAQAGAPYRRADQSPSLRLRLGRLGPPRRHRSARAGQNRRLSTDPRRTYLTGHSMGGHGTWHLGVTFPDRVCRDRPQRRLDQHVVVRGSKTDRVSHVQLEALVARASAPSDTLALVRNLRALGRLRAARRCRRQRTGQPGPADAAGSRGISPRFRLSRTAGRGSLVGKRLRRLAATV